MSLTGQRKADAAHRPAGLAPLGLAAVAIVVFAALPVYGIPRLTLNLAAEACLLGIACTGINLLLAYGGMLSLGSAGFLGTSAYTVALTTSHWHWPLVPAILAAIALTMALAVIVGFVLVRLSQHYFAVAYLGLATAFAGLIAAYPNATNGTSGMTTLRVLGLGFTTVQSNLGWYVVGLVCAAISLAVYRWAVAGRRGRIFKLVRADDLVASVLGVRTFRARLGLFVLASFFPALAGALFFPFEGLITPDSVGAIESVQLVALVVIGGVGYSYGGFLGALVILWVQALVDTAGNYSLLVYGLVFLLCAFYLRAGIGGAVSDAAQRLRRRAAVRRARHAPDGEAVAAHGRAAERRVDDPSVARAHSERDGMSVGVHGERRNLEITDASRRFGGVVAVDSVSLTLEAGRVTALIGSNGAGKSTLVNMISGVERLDGGRVSLGTQDITALGAAQRTRLGVARTFQVPRLVEDLSVLDNVMLGREAGEGTVWWRSAAREREHRETALERLAKAGLDELAQRRVSTLGTGERKFVELVRALDEEPSVCLLDEPAVGLSLGEIEQLQEWIVRLRDAGAAVLVIDHNLDFVQRLADFVYVMDVGRIVRSGPPQELLGSREARGALLRPAEGAA